MFVRVAGNKLALVLTTLNFVCETKADLTQVVQRLDNAIHQKNHYPVDSMVCYTITLDSTFYYCKWRALFQPLNNWHQLRCSLFQVAKVTPSEAFSSIFVRFSLVNRKEKDTNPTHLCHFLHFLLPQL